MTRDEFYSLKTAKKKKKTIEISEEEFELLLKEAGLTKKDFLNIVGCYENNLYRWAREKQYPPYIKTILTWAIKARKYENQTHNILENTDERQSEYELYKSLKAQNTNLKERIKEFKELEKLYLEILNDTKS